MAAAFDGIAIFDRNLVTGALTQKAMTAGCIHASGADGCALGVAIGAPTSLVVSPDGRNVYSTSSVALTIFDRDASTGALTQKAGTAGCVSHSHVACTAGVALESPSAVALSPDGRNVYVSTVTSDAVATFDRDLATGALTQKAGLAACISETGTSGACRDGVALDGATDLAVSADGLNVYVASATSDAVAVLNRNRSTGELTAKIGSATCVSETGTGGACGNGVALVGARGVAVSPDLRSVFVTAGTTGAVAVFDRTTAVGTFAGTLAQKPGLAGCVSADGTGGSCTAFVPTSTAWGVATSPDGGHVYVTSPGNAAVTVFRRFVLAYDIDGDGDFLPLTDGLLLLRFSFGFTGAVLVTGAVNMGGCTRCTAPAIEAYIESLAAP